MEAVMLEAEPPLRGRTHRRLALVAIAFSAVAAACILLLTVRPLQSAVKLTSWQELRADVKEETIRMLARFRAAQRKHEALVETTESSDGVPAQSYGEGVKEQTNKMLAKFRAAQRKQEALDESTESSGSGPALLRHLYRGEKSQIPATGLSARKPNRKSAANTASVTGCLTDRCLTEARDKAIEGQNVAIKALQHQHHSAKLDHKAEITVNDMREDEVPHCAFPMRLLMRSCESHPTLFSQVPPLSLSSSLRPSLSPCPPNAMRCFQVF